MAEFTEDELKQLGVVLPYTPVSMCKKALKLALLAIRDVPKDTVIEFLNRNIKLLLVKHDGVDISKIEALAEHVQPMPQINEMPGGFDGFIQTFNDIMPEEVINLSDECEKLNLKELKIFLATGIFAQIILFNAKAQKIRWWQFIKKAQLIDAMTSSIELPHRFLRSYDSDTSYMRIIVGRQAGNKKSNQLKHEIHQDFFEFYDANKHRWSKAECVRQFYKPLPEEKKIYASVDAAIRNLTKALKKYEKSHTPAKRVP